MSVPAGGSAKAPGSPKSYGTAVVLCGIFGTVGVHHFYLGNVLHGLFDLGLFIAAIAFNAAGFTTGNSGLIGIGVTLVLVDIIHTFIIFYRLIVGVQRDGSGLLVTHKH